jgi:teichuronic acid exporter
MTNSLRSRTFNALFWSFIWAISQQGVRFAAGIILARILFPDQFGLIGMLLVFMTVAQSFIDSGFGAALTQKINITKLEICSIFYFNIFVGFVSSGILCLVAPLIAAFYSQPILTNLTRVLSFSIFINSFGLIQSVLFTKQLNFKSQTLIALITAILSGAIGIVLAINGFGVWSLAIQQLSSSLIGTICLWIFSSWRPNIIFSFNSLKGMLSFGFRIFFAGLLTTVFDNIYTLVIGKLFSTSDLGLYARAKNFQELPSNTLSSFIVRVAFPVFSSIQDSPTKLKDVVKKALSMLVLVNFPMMIGLALIAHPLVLVLLTEKWILCIPYLQLFCAVGFLYPLHYINLNVLISLGRSDLYLRIEIIKKALIIINIFITWRWGISAMIYGMITMSIVSYFLNSYFTGVLLKYTIWEQMRDLFPYLITSIIMGVAVYLIGLFPLLNNGIMLLLQISMGIILYIALCLLFRLSAFMELFEMLRNKICEKK